MHVHMCIRVTTTVSVHTCACAYMCDVCEITTTVSAHTCACVYLGDLCEIFVLLRIRNVCICLTCVMFSCSYRFEFHH